MADASYDQQPTLRRDIATQVLEFLTERSGVSIAVRDLQLALGYPEHDAAEPLSNPVSRAVQQLRDTGKVHVVQPRGGQPTVSVLTWPEQPDQWATWSVPDRLEGAEIVQLMNRHHVTIADLAARTQITQKRIREVREGKGLSGRETVRDWMEAITKPPIAGDVFTLKDHAQFRQRANAGDITAAEWRADFERMLASRPEFVARLMAEYNATQLKQWAGSFGNVVPKQSTKYDNAKAVYHALLQAFLITDGLLYNPKHETHEEAVARDVRAIDQAKLDAHLQRRGLDRALHDKALCTPDTLKEFHTFVIRRGEADLTDEQLASFDTLQANVSRASRHIGDLAQSIVASFKDSPDGKAELAERHEWKQQEAANRLTRLAMDIHQRADEVIEQSRATQYWAVWSSALRPGDRGRAYADQALARIVARVAAALQAGTAKYLDGIRDKTHVELLQQLAFRAKSTRYQQLESKNSFDLKFEGHDELAAVHDRPFGLPDVRFTKYPYPTIWRRHLKEAVGKSVRARGAKLACSSMTMRLRTDKAEFVCFKTDGDIEELTEFLSRVRYAGHDTDWMDRELADFTRLRNADIHTLPELRCALRELLPLLAEPTCDASAAIAERELAGQRLPGFFPTPAPVIRQMLALADMHDHHRVLEPSVGKGDIADAIRRKHPAVFLTVVEINRTLAELLTAKGYDPVFGDFLQFGSGEYYDRILMTPPFERGQDMAHIRHAYSLLATGGRLVAVMSEDTSLSEDSHSQAFREWLRRVGGSVEALPPDAFRGTDAFQKMSIRTQLVVIDKP